MSLLCPGAYRCFVGEAGCSSPQFHLDRFSAVEVVRGLASNSTLSNAVASKKVVFCAPIEMSRASRETACEKLFETGRADGLFLLSEPVALSYATGLSSCRVVDAGHRGVRVSYVNDGETQKFLACTYDHTVSLSKLLERLPDESSHAPLVLAGGNSARFRREVGERCLTLRESHLGVFVGASIYGKAISEDCSIYISRTEYAETGSQIVHCRCPI